MRAIHIPIAFALSASHVASATVVCPGATTVEGVDVDSSNGTVDWSMVQASGAGFAFAALGDGLAADSQFAANWAGIKNAGLVRGAYQFFRPGGDPTMQANLAISSVGGTLGSGDLPIVVDV